MGGECVKEGNIISSYIIEKGTNKSLCEQVSPLTAKQKEKLGLSFAVRTGLVTGFAAFIAKRRKNPDLLGERVRDPA